jgi:GntR family transcriptional regulator
MFSVDFQSRVSLYEQIVMQVERFITTGILKENEQLPSVRQVAFELGINPNTIQRAYTELERRGVIYTVVGKGSFVTDKTNTIIDKKVNETLDVIKDNIKMLKKFGLSEVQIKDEIFKD